MGKGVVRWLGAFVLTVSIFAAGVAPGMAFPAQPAGDGDTPTLRPGAQPLEQDDELEAMLLARDQAFIAGRLAGDNQLSVEQAGALRAAAHDAATQLKGAAAAGPTTFNSAWSAMGPNPIVQNGRSDGSFEAMSGRIGALAIRKNGQLILGAAQGGIWTYNAATKQWTSRTDDLPSLSTGALAVAPSNDLIVYDGTGEGALSGDSYYGNGILKSLDGGFTWTHVSGDFFAGVSISRLAVDPNNANHLYAAVLRGRGGARRVSPPLHSTYGIWESADGGVSWTLLKAAPAVSLGATDLRLDPQTPTTLYASFWSDAIYKSTDGGATWTPMMSGLPTNANFAAGLTRFALSVSHPVGKPAVLYTGFDWVEPAPSNAHHDGRLFKSIGGASWTELPTNGPTAADSVLGYCGTQCFYDNVIEADPTNSDIVFAAGSFGYGLSPQSGGVYRSVDGGASWKNMGWNQHPDFHALAFDPNNTANVLVGSDGGVWYSTARGGRNTSGDQLSAVDWQNLNGSVNPGNAGVTGRTGLQISQFTSIAAVPTTLVGKGLQSERFWGGTQDNGTLRKSVNSGTWFDVASGDGGQVQVDLTDSNDCGFGACFVYGTYFGTSLYRISDGGAGFFTNATITRGINLSDRSDFYIPVALNQLSTNQLFTATYRLYRTDNAKAASAGDVIFKAISPDLTSGCPGAAPNGARACVISAIGIGGGNGVYTGSEDGYVFVSPNAMTSDNPTWTRVGLHGNSANSNGQGSTGLRANAMLPRRPVAGITVDRSNYRVAYIAYNGYNAATPHQPGHVFKTSDGGASWDDVSGNLPDNPVNSISIDASYPNTLYAATDVGPFVTYDGGASWSPLGTGFPVVAIDQIDLNTYDRLLIAGTHGRGAFRLQDNSTPVPALVISKADAGTPVGPGSNIDYTITVGNIGNANATGVTINDPIPANTTFVSAGEGGVNNNGTVTWSGLSVARNANTKVHLRVKINASLTAKTIIDDGFSATSAQGPSANGSPLVTPIAPKFAVSVSPATQTDGTRAGQSVTYPLSVKNLGYTTDSYTMSSTGGTFPVSFLDATCTTALTTTPSLTAGSSTNVCVKVDVPAAAANDATSTATVTATSVGSPSVSASASIKTIAVTVDTLVVDDDSFVPSSSKNLDVRSYYTAALTSNGKTFSVWDLGTDKNLPLNYLKAFKNVVWFTGNSYPSPITPYESRLAAFLDNGGRLFMSGQDLLDQAGGTTPFVSNYLHITWDDRTMNDIKTTQVNGVAGTLTAGITNVPLDSSLLANNFMDEIGVKADPGASAIFTDDATKPDALSYDGTYKVVFLAFPFEEYGTAAQRADLMGRAFNFFG